jgi:hypothetical protein
LRLRVGRCSPWRQPRRSRLNHCLGPFLKIWWCWANFPLQLSWVAEFLMALTGCKRPNIQQSHHIPQNTVEQKTSTSAQCGTHSHVGNLHHIIRHFFLVRGRFLQPFFFLLSSRPVSLMFLSFSLILFNRSPKMA